MTASASVASRSVRTMNSRKAVGDWKRALVCDRCSIARGTSDHYPFPLQFCPRCGSEVVELRVARRILTKERVFPWLPIYTWVHTHYRVQFLGETKEIPRG